MTDGDVRTRQRAGVWENVVEGEPRPRSRHADARQAIVAGEAIATGLGSTHVVEGGDRSTVVDVPEYLDGA